MSDKNTYYVCSGCANTFINSDDSWVDAFDNETAQAYRESMEAFADRVGNVTDGGMIPGDGGYYECECCCDIDLGSRYVLESV